MSATTATGSDLILERMMALHPKIIDLTLDRVYRLLEALGNPQENLPPVIHVAGTNGKGSTIAMIRAGLEASGKRVHVYTSPHLARFHERIRLAGKLIDEEALTDLLDRCYEANNGETITYFEITTVAAILAFAETPADYVLLEVGLGGRLDATNVVAKPALTVITSVDIDHQQFLGETLAEIAGEKAGILKPGVPCVVARQQPEAREVIEARAETVGAPLLIAGQDWQCYQERGGLTFQDGNGLIELPMPALRGPHQIENAGNAIAALRALGMDAHACEAAMETAHWPARMQYLREGRLVELAAPAELWLDGGHNPAAARTLAETLRALPHRPTYLICGMLNTKDVVGYMEPLAKVANGLIAVQIPGEANTLSAAETADAARRGGFSDVSEAGSAPLAIEQIKSISPDARILICGSLYLAGHILRENGAGVE